MKPRFALVPALLMAIAPACSSAVPAAGLPSVDSGRGPELRAVGAWLADTYEDCSTFRFYPGEPSQEERRRGVRADLFEGIEFRIAPYAIAEDALDQQELLDALDDGSSWDSVAIDSTSAVRCSRSSGTADVGVKITLLAERNSYSLYIADVTESITIHDSWLLIVVREELEARVVADFFF